MTYRFLLCMLLVSCKPTPSQTQVGWREEFDGPTLNTQNWSFDIGTGSSGWGNNELQYYTGRPDNVFIRNGMLHIRALREDFAGSAYTSARIKTHNKVSFRHGRFEIRAKMPIGAGMWPAIWMLSDENRFGGWPRSGEIDIMEYLGHQPDRVHGTIHFGPQWPSTQRTASLRVGSNLSEDFHIYAFEWTPEQMVWSIDGTVYHTLPRSNIPADPYPFDESFYLILNLAVGGNWPGNPDANTRFPQDFIIDHIRYTP